MNIVRVRSVFVILFCICSNFIIARQLSNDADTTKKFSKNLWICNSMGLGYAERSMMYGDQLYFGYKNFAVGARARSGLKKYLGTENINPYTGYDDYKFVDEYALLIGYRKYNWKSTRFIIAAGPLVRYDKIKYWPTKGSGNVPFWGQLLTEKESVMNYGVTASVEAYHVNKKGWNGFSFFLFTSVTKNHFIIGATLNWVIGAGI
jgi:hypothetical protein